MDGMEAVLEGLTPEQRAAVEHIDGPMLVLAGPGSGKTTVVTRRIAHLIAQGVASWSILALTFTNKAAGEMRGRVASLIDTQRSGAHDLVMSTFHAFCALVLREYGERVIGTTSFTIYDTTDQRDAVKRALRACDLGTDNWRPASVLAAISDAKNRLIGPDELAASAVDFHDRTIARIYRVYDQILRDSGAVDFDDLLLAVATLLRCDEEVRSAMQERFTHVLVDEYQDTNHAQFVIADAIASVHRNICVVGDPDQSIYAWRGADISNILEFESHYGEARVVPLGRNFRSTGHIVKAAAGLIECNTLRKSKPLYTDLPEGDRVQVGSEPNEHAEARRILAAAAARGDDGMPWREMAVLYRVNALSRVLEDAFRDAGVPYVIARGTAFYERREVREGLSWLRLLVNARDDVAFRRAVAAPARGVGKVTMDRLAALATNNGSSLAHAAALASREAGFSARAASSLNEMAALLEAWRVDGGSVAGEMACSSLADLVERVVRGSGLERMYSSGRSEEDLERLENLEELVSAASEFEQRSDATQSPLVLLAAYLESVALISDADVIDPEAGAVTLMTLHAAKGLEFDFIAIAGLEEGLLPHVRSIDDDTQLEEERRLCYVGMTRARRALMLTHARSRSQRGMTHRSVPSRFLEELPRDAVERDEPVDPWADVTSDGDAAVAASPAGDIASGSLVRHARFGIGHVRQVRRRRRGTTAMVEFEHGVKHLVLEYAALEVLTEDDLVDLQ